MKERPILFQGAMVRALLDGSKTQTRRVVKPWEPKSTNTAIPADAEYLPDFTVYRSTCPYGQPGDRLWVRESFNPWRFPGTGNVQIEYAADGEKVTCAVPLGKPYKLPDDDESLEGDQNPARFIRGKGRPSIHMPRWASRILLEIVSVRVGRLNDISEDDAFDEGIQFLNGRYTFNGGMHESRTARESFRALWESINGDGSWDINPWLWCISFKRVAP